jgi:hypothetical protein
MGKPHTGVGHNHEHPEAVNCYTSQEDSAHNPGKPPVQSQDGYCAGLTFDNLFINKDWSDRNLRPSPAAGAEALKRVTADYEAAKENLLGQLVDVVMSAYSYKETRFANASYSDDWNLTDIRHHVIVYVDKDSFDTQSDWTILVRVQQADDPNISLFNRPTRKLIKDNFKPLQLSNSKTIYWAQVEMTGQLSDASLKKTIDDHKQTLDALAQQNENVLKRVVAK